MTTTVNLRICALLLLVLGVTGCRETARCRTGTVLIDLSCPAFPDADGFQLTVRDLDSGASKPLTVVDQPCASGLLYELALTDYRPNRRLSLTLQPLSKGQPTGDAPAQKEISALEAECTRIKLEFASGGGDGVRDAAMVDAPVVPDSSVAPRDASPSSDSGAGAQTCSRDDECPTGFCVDGVCCASRCADPCHACAEALHKVPGADGQCRPVPGGDDPDGDCAEQPATTCGTDGTCDGQGACRKHSAGTKCGQASCTSDGVVASAPACDGNGTCKTPETSSCSGYRCESGACRQGCERDDQCVGVRCIDGACGGKRALGKACAGNGECASNQCIDGVCCEDACGGTCRACKETLTGEMNGLCRPVKAGLADPDGACSAEAAQSCGRDGTCDGNGACRKHGTSTGCRAGACSGNTHVSAGTCNGQGMCPAAVMTDCGRYLCTAAGCKSSCASDADCATGSFCEGNQCVAARAAGQDCARARQCANGFCSDGKCCNADCSGACKQCLTGTCVAVVNKEDADTCGGATNICGPAGQCLKKDGQPCSDRAECYSNRCATYYRDQDGDGYGGAATMLCGFEPAAGYTNNSGDCCDIDKDSHPFFTNPDGSELTLATNLCGSWDRDCDGAVEERLRECPAQCSATPETAYNCIAYSGAKGCGQAGINQFCVYSMFGYQGMTKQSCW